MSTTAATPLTALPATARRSVARLLVPLMLVVGALSLLAPTKAEAASSTTGDVTACAYGAFTRNVPIQLHVWSGSSWSVLRNGTTGTGCGTWRDVPANRWYAVTVKTTTYGSYQTCGYYPGSWYQISGGTNSFYVSPWQSARVNLQVQRYNFC